LLPSFFFLPSCFVFGGFCCCFGAASPVSCNSLSFSFSFSFLANSACHFLIKVNNSLASLLLMK